MHRPDPAVISDGLPSAQVLSGRLVPALRESIVDGTYAPGTRLSEQAVATLFGVSRTPVREAFAQLEREGLVITVARTGVFVRMIDAREAEDIYETREALETQAARLAARKQTPVGIARMRERLAVLGAAAQLHDVTHYTAALDQFYETLMELAGNDVLHQFYETLMELAGNDVLRRSYEALTGPVRRLRRIAMRYAGRLEASYEHAVAIVDAIASGDADRAEREMRSQLSTAREAVLAVLTTQP